MLVTLVDGRKIRMPRFQSVFEGDGFFDAGVGADGDGLGHTIFRACDAVLEEDRNA